MSKVTPEAYKTALDAALQAELTQRMDHIKEHVACILDANVQEVTAKLLGFNNSWGEWEVDSCNGRAGDSAAGDYLRKRAQEAIAEWLSSVKLPTMSPALKTALKKEYTQQCRYWAESALQDLARKNAERMAEELAAQASGVPMETAEE